MPIKVKPEESEQDFISRCMSDEKDSFPDQEQRLAVCYSYWKDKDNMGVSEEAQQGGVVSPSSFGRTKFGFRPNAKEKLNEYMGRCMGDAMVRERKQDRIARAQFCFREFQNYYINNIGKNWK